MNKFHLSWRFNSLEVDTKEILQLLVCFWFVFCLFVCLFFNKSNELTGPGHSNTAGWSNERGVTIKQVGKGQISTVKR